MSNSAQKRLLLIEPPFYRLYKDTYSLQRFPLSIGYLSAQVKAQTDWEVIAYNADFHPQTEAMKFSYMSGAGYERYLSLLKDETASIWSEIRKEIEACQPNVIGITSKSQNFASACIVAKIAKSINPSILVVVGGPHPSLDCQAVLEHKEFDVAVKGEGEWTLLEILRSCETGSSFENILGIAYRMGDQISENADRPFASDLDELSAPHIHAPEVLKDFSLYPLSALSNVFATRGCPYNCFFCGSRNIWSRKPRFRSAENVAKEIKGLQAMGIRMVNIADDTFGITSNYIASLCAAIQSEAPGIKWSCEMPVALITDDNLRIMKEAGCVNIAIGIESGNNEILKAIRKNIRIEDALAACARVKKHHIGVHVFFIVGFPQDTEATINDTFTAIKKAKCDSISYSIFTPYPGTEAFDICKAEGLIGDDFDVALYNHQSPANHFCKAVSPERFRQLATEIERVVDRKNARMKVRRLFTRSSFNRLREVGLAKGIRKGLQVLRGR